MRTLENIEQILTEYVYPDLEKGRPGWDLEHTKAVVFYTKKLLDIHKNLDKIVQITSAFAHDWGYSGLFDGNSDPSLDDIKEYKSLHMVKGANLISNMMNKEKAFEELSIIQKTRITHLVSVHDKLDELNDEDELVLMEADTLGALDINFITPTFTPDSNRRFMENTKARRISRFITPEAKIWAEELFEQRLKLYN